MEKIKLLYVDDEESNLSNFKITFGAEYNVLTATSGQEALSVFTQEGDVAIVVADQRMPGMTGVECLERIYHIAPDSIRMVLTAYLESEDIIEAINRGHVYQYFFKPWKEVELRRAFDLVREKFLLARENRLLSLELGERNVQLEKVNIQLVEDIKKRKQAEGKIRILTQELFKAQENERRRIALDLHDNVAQDLFSLKIAFETVFDDFPKVPQRLKTRGKKMSELLGRCIKTLRDMSCGLRPFNLDQLGLVAAVSQYCEEFAGNHGLRLDFEAAGMDGLRLDSELEINLYRVIQEALSNIGKHAQASTVEVKLVASYPVLIIRIEDDGQGFDVKKRSVEAMHEKRMGLQSMDERVSLINGTMNVKSRLNMGTKIFIEIPLSGGAQ
ncbi:MAG: response regulator [Proteobacteria bacterium]|nr:response regulator [Pseudomonadota bacterium]MBU1715381.1 response regulator [Pseudomonadota bacterium]